MAEYIDKKTAIADLNETYDKMAGCHPQFYNGYQFAVYRLRVFPTAVDAVEVCYCKDCEWRDADGDCLNPKCGKSWYGYPVSDNHYCSYGERKEG